MSAYPDVRLRRFRRTGALRGLVRETRLDLEAFVMPLFVAPQSLRNEALPGMSRHTVDDLVREVEVLVRGGVQAVMLFGVPGCRARLRPTHVIRVLAGGYTSLQSGGQSLAWRYGYVGR